MSLSEIERKRKKEIRKLSYWWKSLVVGKNFVIPETIEEAKKFDWLGPKIRIQKQDWYLNKVAKERLSRFIDCLYRIPELKDQNSYQSIYRTALKFLGTSLYVKELKKKVIDPRKDILYIIQRLFQLRKNYRFVHSIEGVDLSDLTHLSIGKAKIFVYTSHMLDALEQLPNSQGEREWFRKSVVPFVNEHFLDKTCIECSVCGDKDRALEIASSEIRQALNILRFIACLFAHEIISKNRIKIRAVHEFHQETERILCINDSDSKFSLSYGSGLKADTKMPLSKDRVHDIAKKCYFGELLQILEKDHLTEVEGAILTSIYWIGEAQDDYVHDSSYIKYWTSMETIFSISEKDITQALARGISILVAFGGYDFIDTKDVGKTYKTMKKHYNIRSMIVHRGMKHRVLPYDLNEICKFSTWCVLSLLSLREKGYETLSSIKKQIDRLSNSLNLR